MQANPGFDTGYSADNLLSAKNEVFTSSPYPINVPSQDFFTNIASNFTNSTAPLTAAPCKSTMQFKKVCAKHMRATPHSTCIFLSQWILQTCLSGCSSFKKQKKIRKDCQQVCELRGCWRMCIPMLGCLHPVAMAYVTSLACLQCSNAQCRLL